MGLTRREAEQLGISHLYPKRSGRPARVPGVPNLTERRFAEHLEIRKLAGEIRSFAYEPEVLRLGPEMTYCPDFRIEEFDGSFTMVDVKGRYIFEDSVIKIKAAAVMYPQHRFMQAKWTRDKGWKFRVFRAR
jgi:alpha-galactosidase